VLRVSKWERGKNDHSSNADGKWHIFFEIWQFVRDIDLSVDTGHTLKYCQPLPLSKLDDRQEAVPHLAELLEGYLEKAKEHLSKLREVETQMASLEAFVTMNGGTRQGP